LGPRIK